MHGSHGPTVNPRILPEMLWARSSYERRRLEADLYVAVSHRELEVYYQPKVNLISGMMRGVEALMRWRHPVLGLLAPSLFLPLAEESGAILDMGRWLIDEVCRQAAEWVEPGFSTTISVNLSAQQLREAQLPAVIAVAATRFDIPVKTLELELTEPRTRTEWDDFLCLLKPLRDSGLRISLDQFTGDSSRLSQLTDLPFEAVKIDRSVIRRIDNDEGTRCALVKVLDVAKERGLETVAEGVERQTQVKNLECLGCNSAQGFFYAEPRPSYRLEYWMEGRV